MKLDQSSLIIINTTHPFLKSPFSLMPNHFTDLLESLFFFHFIDADYLTLDRSQTIVNQVRYKLTKVRFKQLEIQSNNDSNSNCT